MLRALRRLPPDAGQRAGCGGSEREGQRTGRNPHGSRGQMAAAQAEWQRTMEERESALQAEKQAELESAEQEHSKQLATLGRKLADTETELSGAREREQLNQERAEELEAKLKEYVGAVQGPA